MKDMTYIHSLRAGVTYRILKGSLGLSTKNRQTMNTAPWAAQDGSAMGIWYESDLGVKWLTHAGNTGCGDWSRISLMRGETGMCFYHVTCNRPGDDSRPALEWKDFSSKLRELTLQATR